MHGGALDFKPYLDTKVLMMSLNLGHKPHFCKKIMLLKEIWWRI